MLETIRPFAEEHLATGGAAAEVRTAHSRYFAQREADILRLWDSPRQREAYTVGEAPSRIPLVRGKRLGFEQHAPRHEALPALVGNARNAQMGADRQAIGSCTDWADVHHPPG